MPRQLFALVGPSGVGKNTIMRKAMARIGREAAQMPTATTRQPRDGEQPGREHLFLTDAQFDEALTHRRFVEWQPVHEHRYGTLREVLAACFAANREHFADIEVLGATTLKALYPDRVTTVFVAPPSLHDLERRLRGRGTDPVDVVQLRLSRAAFEFAYLAACDHLILNADQEQAAGELCALVRPESQPARPEPAISCWTAALVFDPAGAGYLGPEDAGGLAWRRVPRGQVAHEAFAAEAAARLVDLAPRGAVGSPEPPVKPLAVNLDPGDAGLQVEIIYAAEPTIPLPSGAWRPLPQLRQSLPPPLADQVLSLLRARGRA